MSRIAYHARWVVPVASPPVRDGTVVVDGRDIAWVGPRAAAPPTALQHDLGACVLLPGLVNTHTHLELTAFRGFLEGLPFFDWVRTLTRARREVLGEHDLLDAARLGVVEGLLAGVTTFADTADSDAPLRALLESGARGIAYREVFGPDPAQVGAALAELQARVAAMRQLADDRVAVGVSPHAPYSVSDALYRAVAAWARSSRLPIAVHLAEGADESALVRDGEGPFARFLDGRGIACAPRAESPVRLLDALGVLGPSTLCIHVVRADEADVGRLAARGAAVAHCPVSNAKLGHGAAPLLAMRAAGVRLGLGSDSMASNNRMELREEARIAALMARVGTPDAPPLSADELVRLATLDGAVALGMDATIGALTPGRRADLVAFPLPVSQAPVQDPCDALIWGGVSPHAVLVLVDGQPLVREGRLLGVDVDALARRVDDQARRLAAWRG